MTSVTSDDPIMLNPVHHVQTFYQIKSTAFTMRDGMSNNFDGSYFSSTKGLGETKV